MGYTKEEYEKIYLEQKEKAKNIFSRLNPETKKLFETYYSLINTIRGFDEEE